MPLMFSKFVSSEDGKPKKKREMPSTLESSEPVSGTRNWSFLYERSLLWGKKLFRCNPVLFRPGESGKGHCITIPNYNNVTLQCFEKAAKDPKQIFDSFKNNPTLRENYLSMAKELIQFCETSPTYSACEYLLAAIYSAQNFVCDNELENLFGSREFEALLKNWDRVTQLAYKNSNPATVIVNAVNDEPKPVPPPSAPQPAFSELNKSCEERFNGKNVLYIGDSHSYLRNANNGRMGNEVYNKIASCGASAIRYESFCGSRPVNFADGRRPSTSCGYSSINSNGFETKKVSVEKPFRPF